MSAFFVGHMVENDELAVLTRCGASIVTFPPRGVPPAEGKIEN
jgi:hypothetical protein